MAEKGKEENEQEMGGGGRGGLDRGYIYIVSTNCIMIEY